jgi:hypothetical protein
LTKRGTLFKEMEISATLNPKTPDEHGKEVKVETSHGPGTFRYIPVRLQNQGQEIAALAALLAAVGLALWITRKLRPKVFSLSAGSPTRSSTISINGSEYTHPAHDDSV